MRIASRLALVALTFAAVACGSAVSSKEDAAKAANIIASQGAGAQSGAGSLIQQGIGSDFAITIPGKSGSAKLTMKTDASENGAVIAYSIEYAEFSADGKNTLDGKMDYSVKVTGDASSMRSETTMKGTVTLTGEFDSEIEMDVTMAADVAMSAGKGSVSLTMDGFVKADGTQYDYAHEAITVNIDG